jgi:hypothetical protein
MEAELPKAMFMDPESLAMLFTAPNELIYVEHECYRSNVEDGSLEGGLRRGFTEYCENDIYSNMIAWSFEGGESIYYLTENFMYIFKLVGYEESPIVLITQFERGRWIRKDSWLNLHSVGVGKEFLKDYPDKKIPMFWEG